MASSQKSAQQTQEQLQPQQQEQVLEGLQELTLSTPVDKLDVLCEFLVDFDNLTKNGMICLDP